jgi:hypothetical protein
VETPNTEPQPDPTPAEYTWTVIGEPDTTITKKPDNPTDKLSATFEFTSDQADATFQCSVDGSEFQTCTSPFIAGPLEGDTTHEFEVRAGNRFKDLDGFQIVDQTPASYEWTIQDIETPDTTISKVTYLDWTDLTNPDSLKFEFSGSDNRTSEFDLGFECRLDNGPWESCDESPHYLSLEGLNLAAGEHTYEIRAVDEIGNVDPTPAKHTFEADAVPDTTIAAGSGPEDKLPEDPGVQTDSKSATFSFTSDVPEATFMCSLDRQPENFTTCPADGTFTDVPYGEHELLVQAVGPGRLVDPTPAEYTWESGHLTAPDVTIASGPTPASDPEATTESTTARFEFSSTDTDPSVRFQCSVDGGPLNFCTSPKEYTGLQSGVQHTFEVQATKPNLLAPESEAAVWEWTIADNAAPTTEFIKTPADPSAAGPEAKPNAEPPVFEFRGNDNGGTPAAELDFECALDEAEFSSCSSPHELQGLAAGEHTLQVRATDQAGNVGTSVSYTWRVVAAPETMITSMPEDPSLSADATFEFSDQTGSTYECVLDPIDGEPANFQPCESPKTYTGLKNGEHMFQVRATNEFGVVEEPVEHTWTVNAADTTAPDTTFDIKPPARTVNTSATFVFSGTDNQTLPEDLTFECKLDEEPEFSGCSSPHDLQDLGIGQHTLQVRAIDGADPSNVDESPATYTWTITEPGEPNTLTGTDVTVELPIPGGPGNATVTFAEVTAEGTTAISALDSGSPLPADYFQTGALYYDLSTTAQFTAPVTVCLTYNPGSFTEAVRLLHHDGSDWTDITTSVNEAEGRVCGETESLSPFAIAAANPDMAPKTTILAGPDSTTVSTEAQFTFSSSDPSAEFECALDTPAGDQPDWGSCEATQTYTDLPVGEHELLVRAKDELGKVDLTPAGYRWTIKPLPETTIASDSGPKDLLDSELGVQTDSTEATFAFSSDQPGATFECRLDLGGYEPCTSPEEYTDLAFEEHDFFVRAKDADGNVDPTPAEFSWDIADFTPPNTTIDSGPDATTSDTSANFEFSSNESDATFECALDGGNFTACSSPRTYTGLTVGDHRLQVQAIDPTENVDPTPAEYTWTVDTSGPQTTLTSKPDALVSSTSASFAFTSEPGSRFECKLDNGSFTGCSSPQSYTDLSEGSHTFEVRATDEAGNTGSPADYVWTIEEPADITAPETQITEQPAEDGNSAAATFRFTATDNKTPAADLRFECRLDNQASGFVLCTSPQSYSGLGQGLHTFEVRAVDQDGNTGNAVGYTWTVDTDAPQTTIGPKPDALTKSTSASFTFSSEPDATFECALDGAPFAVCLSPQSYSDLSIGEHHFEVRAIDRAGNVDPTPERYNWRISPPCTTPGTVSAGVDADSWIHQKDSSKNFGTDSILKVTSKSGENARALVRFSLPTVPAGCQVVGAELRLYNASPKEGRTIEVSQLSGPWTQSGVTWNNQPARIGSAATAPSPSASGTMMWSVTAQVQSMYSSGNYGFLIRDAAEGSGDTEQQFHSLEKAPDRPPQLVITLN